MTSTSTCPSCRTPLGAAPRRRTKCPHCGRFIVVRGSQLRTEDEARAIDSCKPLGVSVEQLWAERDALSVSRGSRASASDAAWYLMNQLVVRAPSPHDRKMIYWQMARHLWEEKRDHLHILQLAHEMDLENWRQSADAGYLDLDDLRLGVATARETSCSRCRNLEGRTYSFREAHDTKPIPVPDCSHQREAGRSRGWCRCCYVIVF